MFKAPVPLDFLDYRSLYRDIAHHVKGYRVPEFLSSRLNWVLPPPHPPAKVSSLYPRGGGGGTLACGGGAGADEIQMS